jgi:hypothetical protein
VGFLDDSRRSCNGPEGFATQTTTFCGQSSRVKEQSFFDQGGKAASVVRHGVSGTSRVEYAYLSGVGEVVCAAFLGPDGRVLKTAQLSGTTLWAESTSQTYVHYIPPRRSR